MLLPVSRNYAILLFDLQKFLLCLKLRQCLWIHLNIRAKFDDIYADILLSIIEYIEYNDYFLIMTFPI